MEGYLSNENIKTNDTLYCIGAVSALLLASWAVGPFFTLFIPLPFLYYSRKLGYRQGLKLIGLTLLLAFILGKLTPIEHLFYVIIEFSLLGLLLSEIYRKKLGFGKTILLGTGLMLIIGLFILFLTAQSKGTGPLTLIKNSLKTGIQGIMQASQESGLETGKPSQLETLFIEMALAIFPSLFIIGTGFVVWLNVMLSKPLFRLTGMEYPDFGPLDRWKAPDHLIWGFIAAGFAVFSPWSGLSLIAMNIVIVLAVVYAFHGLSIMIFFFNKYQLSIMARAVIYFIIIFQQLFLIVLALAGIFDQWVDFRKIYKKEKSIDDSEEIR